MTVFVYRCGTFADFIHHLSTEDDQLVQPHIFPVVGDTGTNKGAN